MDESVFGVRGSGTGGPQRWGWNQPPPGVTVEDEAQSSERVNDAELPDGCPGRHPHPAEYRAVQTGAGAARDDQRGARGRRVDAKSPAHRTLAVLCPGPREK